MEQCEDCREAKKHAYSDATTPGFFYPFCMKHCPHERLNEDGICRACGYHDQRGNALPGMLGTKGLEHMRELNLHEAHREMLDDPRLFILSSEGPDITRQSFLARYDGPMHKATPAKVLINIVIVGWIRTRGPLGVTCPL